MSEQLALLPEYLAAHLRLSLLALGLGSAISLPLGIAVARRPGWAAWAVATSGIFQTIPSLALLAFMVPLLAFLGRYVTTWVGFDLPSIGFLPALIALTLYSTLPILQNTITGLAGVPGALREAARGVGMTPRQQLLRVELPLALPVIVAGLRTAAVWVVGTATLSTPVGATSLGNYIFSGLQTRNYTAVSIGCVAAAALAVSLDQLIRRLEGAARRRPRPGSWVAAVAVGLVAWAVFHAWAGRDTRETTVRIGAKTFSEQYILSEFLAGWIETGLGVPTRIVPSLGSTVLFDALCSGELDLYVDYSGTLWATILRGEGLPRGREAVLEEVREGLLERYGIRLVAALGFENTYTLAMSAARARELAVARFSDLAPHSGSLSIGGDYEFFARPEWKALVAHYGFAFARQRSMDASLMYQAVAAGEVDVISAFSTDGRIAAFDLLVLEDDRGVIPPYDAVVLVPETVARARPDLVRRIAALEGRISAPRMRALNRAVDQEGRAPSEVAHELLRELSTAVETGR